MTNTQQDADDAAELKRQERHDLRVYLAGAGLALLLTLASFALLHPLGTMRLPAGIIIGVLALVQMVVHFRCFLHIGFTHKREDLHLILFSTLVLTIMVAGTVWIMGGLALRMAMSSMP
ncbi:cytochrome C oxidase subunit IV family protein [Robbsia sp. Bb-Pol-6]|uniref:Cytochrome bo(3) ubiquinol oxidase subunit 4 n=1 Tax=Robbsia betulipollinis TaxID=2981849 RepID=A0ABT3ZJG5_9BURK|nr:cytochrome C oxidase subunit IV family protein [Robbsia betulipollinis]MCY0386683.1 cytochrome C oxidase subunit IV family protein [Robbsia betulipollinis]